MTVTPNVLPKDPADWFNWVQMRIRVLERHRHGGGEFYSSTLSDIVASTASGFTIDTAYLRQAGDVIQFYASITRTGTTLAGGTTGDLVNVLIGAIQPAYAPAFNSGLMSINALASYYVDSSGNLYLAGLAPNNSWASGTAMIASGTWIIPLDT